ncbi:MAG TPA: L,D-transpeptidase family protein [Sphingomicrobium sp.]
MKRWRIAAAAAAALLAGCSTSPEPQLAAAPPPPPKPLSTLPYLWTLGNAPQAHKDMVAEFGKAGLKPGQYFWTSAIPEGETRVIIDRLTQMAYVYRGEQLVGISTVSTAKQGHITPLGEWTILEKRPFYRSKKYNNAPMPWMERIDEYGIALHGGGTPGYPESHGCIHLPNKFAEKLYGLTKIGTKVVIEG